MAGRVMGRPKTWDEKRTARLAFLIGLGWSCESIAAEMGVSETNLRTKASRLDLEFRNNDEILTGKSIKIAARKRRVPSATIVARIIAIFDQEPNLVEAILDDQEKSQAC